MKFLIICGLILLNFCSCSITPMAARRYEIYQYPEKDLICECLESDANKDRDTK